MLVIRRRPGESIRIGEAVEIEIIECGTKRVKLGVRAPKEIPVWRAEAKAAREQNIAAAGWDRTRSLPLLGPRPDWPEETRLLSGARRPRI
jgi:carbon storage regulator